jgi:hypothetical protein
VPLIEALLDIPKLSSSVLFWNIFLFFLTSAVEQLSEHFIMVRLPKKIETNEVEKQME